MKTAVERQRECRQRKRDIENVTGVTKTVERDMPVIEPRTRLVPIPGDADYMGCCGQVEGQWQVDNTKPSVKGMSGDELVRRLHYIHDWKQSPEYQEVMRRRRQIEPLNLTGLIAPS